MSFTDMSFVGVSCNKKMQEQKQTQNRIDKALAELNDMILKIEKENIVKNSQLFLEFYNLNFKTIVFEKTLPFLKTSNKQTKKLKEFFAMLYQVSQG